MDDEEYFELILEEDPDDFDWDDDEEDGELAHARQMDKDIAYFEDLEELQDDPNYIEFCES